MPRASTLSFSSFIPRSTLTYSFRTLRQHPNLYSIHIYIQGVHVDHRLSSRSARDKAEFHVKSTSPTLRIQPSKFKSNRDNKDIKRLSTWPYIHSSKDLTMAPQLDGYFKQVDSLSENFIDRLRRAVAIPSVSADEERRGDVVKVCSSVHCIWLGTLLTE